MKQSYLIILATTVLWALPVLAEFRDLPTRESARPVTTNGIPHIQIDVEAIPELSEELLRRVSEISGVELQGTVVGRTGSTGFWLNEETKLIRPDSIIRGREFAHLHPDGSLHASLSPELAAMAVDAGWAVYHPWAKQRTGLKGFVMIYTPGSKK